MAAPPARRRPLRSTIARQVAALGLVLCAVALTLAYPLRNYLAQRSALAEAQAEEHTLELRISDLEAQKAALSDPAYIAAEARRRLQYVAPGDTPYRIVLPPAPATAAAGSAAAAAEPQPWYGALWDTVTDGASRPSR